MPQDTPPLVSVITPCYNAAAYLAETIRSVQAQTFTRWEMVIADDASTDESLALAQSFAEDDPRIRVLRLPANTGRPACARNFALSQARGRWLAFLDADDLWNPDKLAAQLASLRRHRRAWGFANVESFDGGEFLPDGLNYSPAWRPSRPFFGELLAGEGVPCLTLIAARRLLERVSPGGEIGRAFDEHPGLKAVEDWDLALRLARESEPDYLSRPIARYRAHAGGISKDPAANVRTRLFLIRKFRRLGAPLALCRRAEALQRSKYAAECMLTNRPPWRSELIRSCLQPPISGRDLYLASLGLMPGAMARRLYAWGLALKRRRLS